jgi:CspA family cold shock protein
VDGRQPGPRNSANPKSSVPQRRQIVSTGTVKWFNPDKGFGFIAPDDGTADIFVHHSAITDMGGYRTLEENQKVEYSASQGPKGLQADQVRAL